MPTKTSLATEFKIQRQQSATLAKTFLYAYFDLSCLGVNKYATHTFVHTSLKLRTKATQRVTHFSERIHSKVNAYLRRPDALRHISSTDTTEFHRQVVADLGIAVESVRMGNRDEDGDIEDLCPALAACIVDLEDGLKAMLATWDEHGVLFWDYDTLPMWSTRKLVNDFARNISVNKLHRLHVSFQSYPSVQSRDRQWSVEIAGRNQVHRKKMEAPLHLLLTTFPGVVSHDKLNNNWIFRGADGVAMAKTYLQNFYENRSYRSMMGSLLR